MSYKCDICKDEGFIYFEKKDEYGNVYQTAKRCKCRIDEINENRIKQANVSELFAKCTFLNFKENSDKQKQVKRMCVEFYRQGIDEKLGDDEKAQFMLLCGQVGSGKTHLAVATMNNFIANSYKALYTNYKDLVRTLSQNAMDKDAYASEIKKCLEADILLIDDLFKSRNSSEITTAQLNYIYEIVNQRYANRQLTIFTTEKSVQQLLDIDEAIGSRIVELAKKKYVVDMTGIANQRMPQKNT